MKFNKITAVVMLCLILCASVLAGCGEKEPQVDLSGTWYGGENSRVAMTITKDGDVYSMEIHWSDSAYQTYKWTSSGKLVDGVISVEDSKSILLTFTDEESPATEEIRYENNKATFTYADEKLTWSEETAEGPINVVFVKN